MDNRFRKRKIPTSQYNNLCGEYRGGITLKEMAKIYEVSVGTIRNILIENQVALRPQGRRKNVTNKQTSKSNPV